MEKKSLFSSEKLFRRLFLSLAIFFGVLIAAQSVPAPQIGDYQSKTSGDWDNANNWQIYTATGWTDTTNYPGQGTTATSQGTYRAYIQPGHEITAPSVTPPSVATNYYFGDVYVLGDISHGDNNLTNDVIGKIILDDSPTYFNLRGTNQNLYLMGGAVYFNEQNTEIGLLVGNSLIIRDFNGDLATGKDGTNGLNYGKNCGGNKKVVFYTTPDGETWIAYGVCQGGNSPYSFPDLNKQGGSLAAIPTATSTQLCAGGSTTLVGFYTGNIPGSNNNINYSWSLVSGPAGFIFGTVSGSMTHPGGTGMISLPDDTQLHLTLNIVGTYVFSLTVSQQYSTEVTVVSTETVTITVYAAGEAFCACWPDPKDGDGTDSKFGITTLGRAGADNGNWPMERKGAVMVLESATKGFVINRVDLSTNPNPILNPVEGMMVYDTSTKKIKIYSLKEGDLNPGWHSFETPTCPPIQ